VRSEHQDPVQIAEVFFTMSGTYAQANNSQVSAVDVMIENSRRNGKTVTLVDAMGGQPARLTSNPKLFMAMKTVAVSTNDITFELTLGATEGTVDHATEHTDATAIGAQDTPFSVLVSFTEA
jgi:hypothetical protein